MLFKYIMLSDSIIESYYLIEAETNECIIKTLLAEFKKVVRDAEYWDAPKFPKFLNEHGIKAEVVKPIELKSW